MKSKNSKSDQQLEIPGRRRFPLLQICTLFAALNFLPAHAAAAASADDDLMNMSLEKLLELEVYGASKYAQKTSEAPASVTIISAADIRNYGYRNLADILKSIRSLHVTNDHNYGYVGVRGFSPPGDFNTRVLFLIDGYRAHDNIYSQGMIGNEFLIDVDLIERVEFIAGPGSSIYGSNALFGVVNIITKSGEALRGTNASFEIGSNRAVGFRASYGAQLNNSANWVLSASRFKTDGQDFTFPDIAANNGSTKGLDADSNYRLYSKLDFSGATLSAAHVWRNKELPTAPFGAEFAVPGTRTIDRQTTLDWRHTGETSAGTLISHVYLADYAYNGIYIYDQAIGSLNDDTGKGNWWGADLRLLNTSFKNHKLVAGIEVENDFRQIQKNFNNNPFLLNTDEKNRGKQVGIYLQDEIRLSDGLIASTGIRYDHHSGFGGITNPRLGLIYSPNPDISIKGLYGSAYRVPNVNERFFQDGTSQTANPALKPEKIKTYEIAYEQRLPEQSRLTASLFNYRASDLIALTPDAATGLDKYDNLKNSNASGIEFGFEKSWSNQMSGRVSYTHQRARDVDSRSTLPNSPEDLAKLNITTPLWQEKLQLGFEAQYTGARKTKLAAVPAFHVENLVIQAPKVFRGGNLTLGIYNLFDKNYADPAGPEHEQDALPQAKRTIRFKAEFKL
ncbi:MAG: TonB-dependent receptor [Burkholderiales bacterium]